MLPSLYNRPYVQKTRTISVLVIVTLLSCFALSGFGQTSKKPAGGTAKQAEPPLTPVTLPSEPGLYAVIYTSMGNIVCRLFETKAPKTVANFVALASGTKTWTDPITGKPRRAPLYSGTTFHRVIPGFMIQGGDPAGDGTGGPGYEIKDEIEPNFSFDRPGILAMANHGPDTNGSQFFITVAPATHLDGHYSAFGEVVSGQDVADAISNVPRNSDDKPLTPVKIMRIMIRKVPAAATASEHAR
ncbi:MAG: peptidylprolyl isomerase [Acidobacteriaceae bacterium]|nr:peptidylprolyl isomerase [Acidobacteriaceae bacterium]